MKLFERFSAKLPKRSGRLKPSGRAVEPNNANATPARGRLLAFLRDLEPPGAAVWPATFRP